MNNINFQLRATDFRREFYNLEPCYAFLILNYKLGSHTAQLRSEARQASMKRKKASMDNDYRLFPLTKEEQSFTGPLGIDLNNTQCISSLQDFFNFGKQLTSVPENGCPMLAQLGLYRPHTVMLNRPLSSAT
jgi:hypothetical protein